MKYGNDEYFEVLSSPLVYNTTEQCEILYMASTLTTILTITLGRFSSCWHDNVRHSFAVIIFHLCPTLIF